MHNFKELKIWQKAMSIAEEVYLITTNFPKEEKYGLTSQVRRCAVSIPSNIAEGSGRNSDGQFRYFLGIASGSANELITQLILAERLKLISNSSIDPIIQKLNEVQKMNYTLIKKFSKRN